MAALTEGHARQAKRKAILAKLKTGSTRRAAYRLAGVSCETFYDWLSKDASFSESVMRAEAEAELAVVAHIENASPSDWRAAQWIVEHHPQMREEWRKAEEIDWSRISTDTLRAILGARGDPEGAAPPQGIADGESLGTLAAEGDAPT